MDIYQLIWDADQSGNGIKPILADNEGSAESGYVRVVNTEGVGDADLKVLSEVVIPDHKKTSYDLVRALFDNYVLDEQHVEVETPEERAEVHELLEAIVDSAPMQVGRAYISEETGTPVSRDRWYATLTEQWFRRFSQNGDRDLSGFEHVFVGEQEGPKIQGYHFWYKYHLDDGLASRIEKFAWSTETERPPTSSLTARRRPIVRVRRSFSDGRASFARWTPSATAAGLTAVG